MNDDELMLSRWLIEPEPTAAEFVALFTAMRRADQVDPSPGEPLETRWSQIARREQLRAALDDTGNGWNR